jgi:hypothetical protein
MHRFAAPKVRQTGADAAAPRLSGAGEAVVRPRLLGAPRGADLPAHGAAASMRKGPAAWGSTCLGRVHPPRGGDPDAPVFVELMAGSRRMAHAAARQGAWGVSFELADDAREDVMASANMRWLRSLPGTCRVAAIWIGLVCASWSRARRNTSGKPGWPGPLRDESRYLWGLPNLNSKQLLWACAFFAGLHTEPYLA